MAKKVFLVFILFFPVLPMMITQESNEWRSFGATVCGNTLFANPSQNKELVANFRQLSRQQLLDTADYYLHKNNFDIALIGYSLAINYPIKSTDAEQYKPVIEAYNKAAVAYYYMCDYRSAYEFLIKALLLCEKYDYPAYLPKIYVNIGNIYYRFDKHDIAKSHYLEALHLAQDTALIVTILNNLGAIETENGNLDSAFYFLNQSLEISKQYHNSHTYSILNNIASLYQKEKRYDSAYHYYRLSLKESEKSNNLEIQAENLSNLGGLFFKLNKTDSALFYIHLSNTIAKKAKFLTVLTENYLTLSKIEESKGHTSNAFEYYKKYANLRDSIFNIKNFGEINQLQRLYEVSKTNQQIEQLALEQQIKEHTIHYQRIIQFITFGVLLLVVIVLLYISFQKRTLNRAYKTLFEKNLEIIDLLNSVENQSKKYEKSPLSDNLQTELLDRILALMEDASVICDSEFTIDKLAELVQSNPTYVSQVINSVLKRNFRSLLNSYRIREAQRLFSEYDDIRYSIEFVAVSVGFKSQNAFRNAFREVTGMNPNFYVKSIQEKSNHPVEYKNA